MPMNTQHHSPRFRQHGAASLLVAIVLLLGGTLIAFFANRGFIFEQRTSANQYRAANAFELAEAGIEWAVGRLNEGMPLLDATSCLTGGAVLPTRDPSFIDRYANPQPPNPAAVPPRPNAWFNVPALVANGPYPQCRFDPANMATNGGWACNCPSVAGAPVNPGTAQQGGFGVRFTAVPGDDQAIEIVARGCSNGATCDPIAAPGDADATAVVRVLVKARSYITGGPTAALTTGTATVSGGNLNVVNQHAPSNGITIHAGTTVQMGSGTNAFTLPGTPPKSSILDNDPSLANLTAADDDAFFHKFFSQDVASYRDSADLVLSGSASANADAIMDAVNNSGGQCDLRFYVDGDARFTNGVVNGRNITSIGYQGCPVTLVITGNLDIQGTVNGWGLFYSATATAGDLVNPGGGTATINGAFISRGGFRKQGAGTFNIVYDPFLWGSGPPGTQLVKVPGSWRDF
jgi:PilX N-terminal